MSNSDNRWKCPKCGSLRVQVSYPAWVWESKFGDFVLAEFDYEADVMSWYCLECESSDSGEPART